MHPGIDKRRVSGAISRIDESAQYRVQKKSAPVTGVSAARRAGEKTRDVGFDIASHDVSARGWADFRGTHRESRVSDKFLQKICRRFRHLFW